MADCVVGSILICNRPAIRKIVVCTAVHKQWHPLSDQHFNGIFFAGLISVFASRGN
jgi:hypothetical protein